MHGFFTFTFSLILCAAGLGLPPGSLLNGAENRSGEEFEDSVFFGLDILVKYGEAFYPVMGYEEGRWLIEVDGTPRSIPAQSAASVKRTIKHSEGFISLTDLETTPLSSDQQRFIDAYNQTASKIGREEDKLMNAKSGVSTSGMSQAELSAMAMGNTEFVENSAIDNISLYEDSLLELENQIINSAESFDALRIKMELISRESLDSCYLVVRARFQSDGESGSADGKEDIRSAMHAYEIGRLVAGETHRVSFVMRGFPKGPEILSMTYHLFSGAGEIPTQYSEQRLPLSEEEAFDFVYADFVGSLEGGRDYPPRIFKPLDSQSFLAVLSQEDLLELNPELEINAMGYVEAVHIERADDDIRAEISRLLKQAKFLPAVRDGVPVDARLSTTIEQLVR